MGRMMQTPELDARLGPEHDTTSQGHWTIDTIVQADWAARKMLAATAKVRDVAEEYDRAIEEWQSAKLAAMARPQRDADFFEHHLLLWLARSVESDSDADPSKAQTVTLPCGVTLAYRPNGGAKRVVIDDEQATIAWLAEHAPEAIKHSVIKSAVKQMMMSDGLAIPGCHIADGDTDPFQIRLP